VGHFPGDFHIKHSKSKERMNKTLFVIAILIFFTSCDEIDKLFTFSINHQVNFQIESSAPLNLPFEIATPDVTTNSNQSFKNNNTSSSLVKDVRLADLKLTVVDPADKTFSFLKSVTLYISTDQNNEIELASQTDIPTTATTITLIPTNAKLDTYVKADSYKLRTSIVTRETLTQTVEVKADLKFKVTAASL
jgi:hypothetical protein